ncbi:hypothetical protein PILCRDRAFT_414825 [Piloderma croceum F 1598]|uniref:Uncharacterized protein n=1 Tax=Piloderma croceum (strain F 1598) TaxID=765440 RepID=A0A0C3FZZ3_PILCF|nr:hypothetical protein PILCRDRAFT_414825 [Piloderma croceum F 1598]
MAGIKPQVASKALRVLDSFLPQLPPPSLDTRTGNLYQVLSRYPQDGVGIRVSQTRWGQKGISNSYWLVTRTKLKLEGQHGKAWGKLYWKGVPTSTRDQRIPGSLKYAWSTGPSRVPPGFRYES